MAQRVVVIGAGPAGLTAGRELVRLGVSTVVLEKGDDVGGLARTVRYEGFHFDLGGHRFLTKIEPVWRVWQEVLGPELLRRPRLSRIYYRGRFFAYPLRPLNALAGLGPREAVAIVASYLRWQLRPYPTEETFEQWVTNRFGHRLFATFFRAYTEKVWGVPCAELRAEWAAQRIKDLSLRTALVNMMLLGRGRRIRTLTEEFHYPRIGPGMMWRTVRDEIVAGGGAVRLGCDVAAVARDGPRVVGVEVSTDGRREFLDATDVISSMPVSELVARLDPPPPSDVLDAAARLRYRDFITVCLIVGRAELFPDNWIYVHDPQVRVGRIQNYKNWSPDMVPDPSRTGLGLEYFCSEGDELWEAPDAELLALATREIETLGLARAADVEDGCVIRVPKAYPVYDSTYAEHLAVVRRFVDGLANLQTIGRNGLHRYDNQDHAMLTGMLAVRNLTHGERHDVWSVNTDAEYHEEVGAGGEQAIDLDRALEPVFSRLDRVAFGVGVGTLGALGLALASLVLVLKGGPVVGPNLRLLAQYLPGYEASVRGALLGVGYGFALGFLAGWTVAVVRNATALFYVAVVRRRAESRILRRLLDYV